MYLLSKDKDFTQLLGRFGSSLELLRPRHSAQLRSAEARADEFPGLETVVAADVPAKYGVGAHKSAAVFGGVVLVACLGGVGYLAFRYWRMKRTVRSYQRALELMDQEDDL